EVVLANRGPQGLSAVVERRLARGHVPEAMRAAEPSLVDARELRDDVVERRGRDAAAPEVDAPAVEAGGVLVAVGRVLDHPRAHEVEPPVAGDVEHDRVPV